MADRGEDTEGRGIGDENIKLAETRVGLGTENVRAPRLNLSGEERKHVLHVIDSSLECRPELPDYQSLELA